VKEVHEPADAEKSGHEASKAIHAIADPLPIGSLRNQSKYDARYECEENSGFKVIEVEFHPWI
jgi:hypothetical protein